MRLILPCKEVYLRACKNSSLSSCANRLYPPHILPNEITEQRVGALGWFEMIKLDSDPSPNPPHMKCKTESINRESSNAVILKEDTHCRRHLQKRPHQPRQPVNIFTLHHQLPKRIHPLRQASQCYTQHFLDVNEHVLEVVVASKEATHQTSLASLYRASRPPTQGRRNSNVAH